MKKTNPRWSRLRLIMLAVSAWVLSANAFGAGPVGGTAEERMASIAAAVPKAVMVFEPSGNGGGSGVLINEQGDALTNFHVTSPCGSFMRCGLADGKIYDAVVIGVDPVGDLALIRLLGESPFPFAKLANSDRVQVGQPCFAVGNPFLLATNLEPSVSWGIVSGIHRYQFPSGTLLEYADCLQTDAAINPGNSGGALFNTDAEVIGIVGRCSFEKRGRINVGIGYAISARQCQNFVGVLRSGRVVDHATLGATASGVEGQRVRITNILENSDAYRRGLRYGDELLELDGREIRTANDLINILGTLPEGWRVPLVYRRGDTRIETLVRLPGVHAPGELVKKMAGALPPSDEPPERKPRGEPKDGEPEPSKDPHGDGEQKADEPEQSFDPRIVAMFEERDQLANEYFNRLGRERMLQSMRQTLPAELTKDSAGWLMQGEVMHANGPAPFLAEVGRDGIRVVIGEEYTSAAPLTELFEAINERTVGGLQAALIVWETLVRDGITGDALYFGTAPLRGQKPLHDRMILTLGDFEASVYTEPQHGRLACIEVQADRDTDPVEVYPRWSDETPGQLLGLEVVYGTDQVLDVQVRAFNVKGAGANP